MQYPFLDGISVTTENTNYSMLDDNKQLLYEVKITILAFVNDGDFLKAKHLEHHAEGIWEEYPFLHNVTVTVEKV